MLANIILEVFRNIDTQIFVFCFCFLQTAELLPIYISAKLLFKDILFILRYVTDL